MLTAPADLDLDELAALLERGWGLDDGLEYLPVGFGSHHWRAAGHFVTVDELDAGHRVADDPFDALARAFATAAWLDLDFVVAPIPDAEGRVLRRLGSRFAVAVLPWVDGESFDWGYWDTDETRSEMLALLDRLHAASVPDGLPRREWFGIPSRDALETALRDLGREWTGGPFAERARELLARHADLVRERLREYDERVARAPRDGWVLTHGEPHRGNAMRARDGRLLLVDWDTTLVAPRERDLWFVVGRDPRGTGADPELLDLYARWWALADLAVFTGVLYRPHADDDQTRASWDNLVEDVGAL